jgi:hypothetical protein
MKARRGSTRRRPHPTERDDPRVVARVEAFFARLDRLGNDGIGQTPVPAADRVRRGEVRDAATAAAIAAGRGQLLEESRRAARELALRRFGSRVFRPTWVGLNWGQSLGTVEDRVAIAEIFDDAATAAVVADIAEPEIAADLLSGLEALESTSPGPPEQSLELALQTRSRFTRALVVVFAFGVIGPILLSMEALGPAGIVGSAVIGVALVMLAISRMAPKLPGDEVDAESDPH